MGVNLHVMNYVSYIPLYMLLSSLMVHYMSVHYSLGLMV